MSARTSRIAPWILPTLLLLAGCASDWIPTAGPSGSTASGPATGTPGGSTSSSGSSSGPAEPATVPVMIDGRPASPSAQVLGQGTKAGGKGGGGKSGGGGTVVTSPAPSTAPSLSPGPSLTPTATPTPAATPTPVVSVGPLAIVGISASHAAAGYAAERAVDGNVSTEWASGQVGTGTLMLTFNQDAAIAGLLIKTGPTATGAQYHIEASLDGTQWTTVLTTRNTSWSLESKTLAGSPQARYLRLRHEAGTATNLAFSVFEVSVQASAVNVPQPEPSSTVTGTVIEVKPGVVLHKATSHILGTNRNHVTSDFPNGAAKLAKLKELAPQWGERKYLYRIGHGPTDGRNDYTYMTGFHFEQTWNKLAPYPYDDIREGLKEANTLGADQMHVINFGTGTPEEAGRYVSYLNKASDANRAQYPIAQQNVKLFEIGNEIAWSMVRGHNTYAPNETVYAQRAKLFAEQMRANSDVPIKIGANGSINSNWEGNGWSGGATTVKNILTTMGNQVDFLLYHGYPSWPLYKSGDLTTLMAQNEWNRQKLEKEIKPAIKQYAGGRDVYIANTEFFTHLYNDVTRSRGMFGALYSADTLVLAMNQDIRTAVQFAFEHKDMADASFFIGNDPNNTTAIFKFQKMLAQHWGDDIVQTVGHGIPAQHVTGASTSLEMPKLAFAAAKTGSTTYLMVVNRTHDSDVTATVNVGATPSAITAHELAGASGWDSANGDVTTRTVSSLANYTFKRASVTLFEIR